MELCEGSCKTAHVSLSESPVAYQHDASVPEAGVCEVAQKRRDSVDVKSYENQSCFEGAPDDVDVAGADQKSPAKLLQGMGFDPSSAKGSCYCGRDMFVEQVSQPPVAPPRL